MLCSDVFLLTLLIDFTVAEHDVLLRRCTINIYGTDWNSLVPHFIAEKSTEKLRGLSKVTQLGGGRSETRNRLLNPNSLFYSLFIFYETSSDQSREKNILKMTKFVNE